MAVSEHGLAIARGKRLAHERRSTSGAPMSYECRAKGYTFGDALNAVMARDDNAVAYKCGECEHCHVLGGRYAVGLDVPHLMAEGRFIAG